MSSGEGAILRAREQDIAWRRVESEIVVLDLRRNAYLSINASGVTLWERMQAGATRAELVAHLVEVHAIDRARADADVAAFVAMLAEKGLLI